EQGDGPTQDDLQAEQDAGLKQSSPGKRIDRDADHERDHHGGNRENPAQKPSSGDGADRHRRGQQHSRNGGTNVRHSLGRRCAGRRQRRIFAQRPMAGSLVISVLGSLASWSGVLFSPRRRKDTLNRSNRKGGRRSSIGRGGSIAQSAN